MASRERVEWTDERLDERMAAIDATFERIFVELAELRAEVRGMRSDFAAFQDRMIQIGFSFAALFFVQLIAVTVALVVGLSR